MIPDEHFQFGGLATLDFLAGIVGESPRTEYSRAQVIELLNKAKTLEELFDPAVVAAYELSIESLRVPEGQVS